MKQEVKIKVSNERFGLIGYFIISAVIKKDYIKNKIKEEENNLKNQYFDDNLNRCDIYLKNVNIVDKIDDITPIEYLNKNNTVKLFLLEESEYEIHFKPNKDIKVFKELLSHNSGDFFKKITDYDGFIRSKGYVGKTFLDIPEFNFKFPIEIKSKKINYDLDYRNMIGDLANYAAALLFNVKSPLFQSFEKHNEKETYYERFVLLEYLFKEENLPLIFEYLSRNLHSLLQTEINTKNISSVKNIGFSELMDIMSNPQNLIESPSYPIIHVKNKSYIPIEVNETTHEDTIDIPENRFYKYFLELIDNEIKILLKLLEEDDLLDCYMADELKLYKSKMNYYLSQKYFNNISKMEYIPLNSQVLQKKEGYRELLDYYSLFDFGINIFWDDLIDDFKTYQKKLSKLYEYWLFFKLESSIEEITPSDDFADKIIDKENNRWAFRLKENDVSINFKEIEIHDKIVNLELCFNKTFSKSKINENESNFIINRGKESYSVELRPDYTIIIRFDGKEFYLHFDAKYKTYYINENVQSYQNADIEKMHAYKDGIINSYASFVLYPGNDKPIIFSDDSKYDYFGVGAIPLNPSNSKSNDELISLIKNHISNLIKMCESNSYD